jgi:hypothetical protein
MKFTDTEMKGILLADDATATGGISHSGETLLDFCVAADLMEADHTEINKALKECGILPVAPCGKNPYEIIDNAAKRGILSDDYCDVYDVLAWVFDRCDNPGRDLDDILDEYEDMEAY